jgi:hypothetical protein
MSLVSMENSISLHLETPSVSSLASLGWKVTFLSILENVNVKYWFKVYKRLIFIILRF